MLYVVIDLSLHAIDIRHITNIQLTIDSIEYLQYIMSILKKFLLKTKMHPLGRNFIMLLDQDSNKEYSGIRTYIFEVNISSNTNQLILF